MGIKLNLKAISQVAKDTVIFHENQPVDVVCLVLKGRVGVYNKGVRMILGSGSFLGVSDLYQGNFVCNYMALDNLVLFAYPVETKESLEAILADNKDYPGIMALSMNKYVEELGKVYRALNKVTQQIYSFLERVYGRYLDYGNKYGHKISNLEQLDALNEYEAESLIDWNKLEYYSSCAMVSMDAQKAYFAGNSLAALYLIEEQAELSGQLITECVRAVNYVSGCFNSLMDDKGECLFRIVAKLAIDIKMSGGNSKELLSIVDELIDEINIVEDLLLKKAGLKISVNRSSMEEIYFTLLTNNNGSEISTDTQVKYSGRNPNEALEKLENSMEQIFRFGKFTEEKASLLRANISDFTNLRDRLSIDDSVRGLRKEASNLFYELYELVFVEAYRVKDLDRVIELFLNYGLLDEKLLSKDQLIALYYLEDVGTETSLYEIYNIRTWLQAIYEGKKDPSKNEYDLDYFDNLREIKKTKRLTPEEEKDYLENPRRKLHYEIKNMFRYNNRVVSGQMSVFYPILYKEMFGGDLERCLVTKDKLEEALKKITDVDYSAFYREILYTNPEKGIIKEYIQKEVRPEIILLPTMGTNGVMWQEISGKKKDTKGRFLLSALRDGNVFDIMLRMVGKFRWELCRSMQGTQWNNINVKSLTSEYSDYIQFYRKNRELSEERKEKIKLQIQKGKNSSRDIFVIDYEIWIKNESSGAMRLNKVVRELLSFYCPFSKEIRQRLSKQIIYEEAMARLDRETIKKVKELEGHFRYIEKDNGEITEELTNTMEFYRDF